MQASHTYDNHRCRAMGYSLIVTLFVVGCPLMITDGDCLMFNATILQAPKSVNISENEETFINCTVIGDHINWKANDTPIQDITNLGFNDSILPLVINESRHERKGMLKIRGSEDINRTNITCHTVLPGGDRSHATAKSKPALILVQGLLDAVTNLSVTNENDEELSITWTAPYTLMNVPILYMVHAYVGKKFTVNVTDTSTSLMHWENYEMFNNVYVIVRPVNKAGMGKIATTSTTLPQNNSQGDSCDKITYPIAITCAVVIFTLVASQSFSVLLIIILCRRKQK